MKPKNQEFHSKNVGGRIPQKEDQAMKPKNLEQLAFDLMNYRKSNFHEETVDRQILASGLLNKKSHHGLQAQYSFLHFTFQEFLAAKHVAETYSSVEIKDFISGHVSSDRWHLVLQFIAGLLARNTKMLVAAFKDCIHAYAEYMEVVNNEIELNSNQVMVMKCLREVDDEGIIQDICNTSILNDVEKIYGADSFSSSDWEAVTFVCRFMKNLTILDLDPMGEDGLQEVIKLLQKRCLKELTLLQQQSKRGGCLTEQVCESLTKLDCKLAHSCAHLVSLKLKCRLKDDTSLSNTCAFFKRDRASYLKKLHFGITRTSDSVKLLDVFCNGNCGKLTELRFEMNALENDVLVLWDTLIRSFHNFHRLTR
ncbi:uncharacterized protein LOC114522702 [Dendronephthya gigantea]|uniref:uncharacterized protein LOC114522702 n=1 Tax=Dendronephthya gigantea TaxID=151771 RepID=UPI001068FA96|nr:uncharacterized protein LOC114522702 [Dendronephthya gigantea]